MSEKFQQSRSVRYGIAGAAVTTLLAASFFPLNSANAQAPQINHHAASVVQAKKDTQQGISLPDGLKPAHGEVFWEDSDACKSFTYEQLNAAYTNESSPVIGCSEGYVAFFNKSFQYYTQLPDAQKDGDYATVHFAQWNGESWNMEPYVGTALSYPELRNLTRDPSMTLEAQMNQQLMDANVWAVDINKLMGPNVPEWTSQTKTNSWVSSKIGDTQLTGNLRSDWTVVPQDFGDGQTWSYIFDEFGGYHYGFNFAATATAPDATCTEQDGTYRIEKSEKISLTHDGQALSIALVSVKNSVYGDYNRIMFVPTKAAKSGDYCSLPEWYHVGENQYVGQFINANLFLESKREIASFAKSQGWKDTVRFAQSLQAS